MIASLTGHLFSKGPSQIILDVHGVGYQVFIPLSTYFALPSLHELLTLHTLTHVRDDAIQLFGFLTTPEKEAFIMLTGISGVGGKLGLSVLSALSVSELIVAIQTEDAEKLASVPGIGKKSAARIVLELKDKIEQLKVKLLGSSPVLPLDHLEGDAASALINLGYRSREVKEAIAKARKTHALPLSLDDLIREALKLLSSQ